MFSKSKKIYRKFNEEKIQIRIYKEFLLTLLKQVYEHHKALNYEKEIVNNFAVYDDIRNTRSLMGKLIMLKIIPHRKKEVVLNINIAEFLVLRELLYFACSLPSSITKISSEDLKACEKLQNDIENIFNILDSNEVRMYWNYMRNKDSIF